MKRGFAILPYLPYNRVMTDLYIFTATRNPIVFTAKKHRLPPTLFFRQSERTENETLILSVLRLSVTSCACFSTRPYRCKRRYRTPSLSTRLTMYSRKARRSYRISSRFSHCRRILRYPFESRERSCCLLTESLLFDRCDDFVRISFHGDLLCLGFAFRLYGESDSATVRISAFVYKYFVILFHSLLSFIYRFLYMSLKQTLSDKSQQSLRKLFSSLTMPSLLKYVCLSSSH